MYRVTVSMSFDAKHRLHFPDGTSEPLHNHVWEVVIDFAGETLDESGMLIDFLAARDKLQKILAGLKNTDLDDWDALNGLSPSAERVAEAFFRLFEADPQFEPTVERVTIREAPGCIAAFEKP